MVEPKYSSLKVFYWKKSEVTVGYLMGKVPSGEEFKRDYRYIWSSGHVIQKRGTVLSRLEEAYMLFNSPDNNPLDNPRGHARLVGVAVGHTSMSVGDVVQMDGVKYIRLSVGWTKLEPLQVAKEKARQQAFIAHTMNPLAHSGCKHHRVIQGRCTKCCRIVPWLPGRG